MELHSHTMVVARLGGDTMNTENQDVAYKLWHLYNMELGIRTSLHTVCELVQKGITAETEKARRNII